MNIKLYFFSISFIIISYVPLSYSNNNYDCIQNYNEIFNQVKKKGTYGSFMDANYICENDNLSELIKSSDNKDKIVSCSSLVQTSFMNHSIDACVDVLYRSNSTSSSEEISYFDQYVACISDNKENLNFIEFSSLKNCQNIELLQRRDSEDKELVDFCISFLESDCSKTRIYQKAQWIYNTYKDEYIYCYKNDKRYFCDDEQELRIMQNHFPHYKYCLKYDSGNDCKSAAVLNAIQNNADLTFNTCRTIGIDDEDCLNEGVLELLEESHTNDISEESNNFLVSCITNTHSSILCKQYIDNNKDILLLLSHSTRCLNDETINQERRDVCILHLPAWYDKYKEGFSYCINKYDDESAKLCKDHFLLNIIQSDYNAFDICLEYQGDEQCGDYHVMEIITKYKAEYIECASWTTENNISTDLCFGLQEEGILDHVLKNWNANKYLMTKYCAKNGDTSNEVEEITPCFHPSKDYTTRVTPFDNLCPISCQTITEALAYCLKRTNTPNNISDCTSSLDNNGVLLCIENHPMSFNYLFQSYTKYQTGRREKAIIGFSECLKKPFYYNFSNKPKKMVRCISRIGYIPLLKRKEQSLTQCIPSSLFDDTFFEHIFPWSKERIETQGEVRDDQIESGNLPLETDVETINSSTDVPR